MLLLLLAGPLSAAAWTSCKVPAPRAVRVSAPSMILLDPEQAAAHPSEAILHLDMLLEHFQGHFDNHNQVIANDAKGLTPRSGGGHEHIHCALRQVPVSGTTSTHVLASYYFNGQPGAVFRERLYAFEALPADAQFGSCIRMSIFKLRDSVVAQLRAAGGVAYCADDVAFTENDVCEALRLKDADVFWRWCGERFEGHMRTESLTIESERNPGARIVVRDDVALWPDALWVNDRGHDAETGDYVYGNIHGVPYKMSRVPETHWTVTGSQP